MRHYSFSCLLFLMYAAMASAQPRLHLIKEFPGSAPPYVEIVLERNGDVLYKDSPTDESPLKFHLAEADTSEIFTLGQKLDKFSRKLESDLKVARMGMKTFRWVEDGKSTEAKFNYSMDPDAKLLLDWFEKIIETEQVFLRLERSVRFDRLGVNASILQVQMTMERKRLVAADQFLPLLDRVIKNEAFLHMARERAAAIADQIRNGPPKVE